MSPFVTCNVPAAMGMDGHCVGAASVDLNKRKGQGDGDGLGPDRVSLGASSPKGRGYHAVARLIRKHSRDSLTISHRNTSSQPSEK